MTFNFLQVSMNQNKRSMFVRLESRVSITSMILACSFGMFPPKNNRLQGRRRIQVQSHRSRIGAKTCAGVMGDTGATELVVGAVKVDSMKKDKFHPFLLVLVECCSRFHLNHYWCSFSFLFFGRNLFYWANGLRHGGCCRDFPILVLELQ